MSEDDIIAQYQLTTPAAKVPSRKRASDAGFDLSSVEDIVISPGNIVSIDTGIKVAVPQGWYYTIEGRSSLFKAGIFPCRGIIDAGYTGNVIVSLCNHSKKPYHITAGDRIAQMIFHKQYNVSFIEVDEFSDEYSMRGEAGFGSSGK